MTPNDSAVGGPERLHPLFLVTGIGGGLRGMAGGYAAIGYLAFSGRLGTALIAAVVLLAVLAGWLLLYWTRFEFRVGTSEIRIDSGILSRTHRSIPFDRIQDVDISQGPVARLLDVAKVKFETGGSAGAGEDEGVLHAIPLGRAQELRSLVRARRSAGGAAAPAETEAEQAPVFAMDLRRVLLAGVFNFSLALFAGLIGATHTFGDVLGFDPLSRSFWLRLLNAGDPIADYILSHRVAAAFAGAALLELIGLTTGIVRTLLREYGFRLDRTEVGLRRRRGLLTRTDVTLPARRAQAAIIGTGPLRDSLGWRDLKLQSLASDEGGGGDHVLAPLARDEEVAAILDSLGWRPLSGQTEWRRVSPAYVWTLAVGLAPLLLLNMLAIFEMTTAFAALVAAAVLVGLVVIRWRGWRRTFYALDDDRLLVRTGWWRRRTVMLPLSRIQSIDLFESFVSRWFGTAGLAFGVAGGGGFSEHKIPALPLETARALRQRLLVLEP